MEKWLFYLQEAQMQIDFAKRSYAEFQKSEASNAVVDVFFHLHHFLVHAANVDKILDAKPETERYNIISKHINLEGIDLKPFRKLRNHLEHFDTRLDQWIQEYDGHPFFDMNIVTAAKGFPEKAFLRALDGDTFKFYGESYSMTELYASVLEIDRRLASAS